MSRWCVLVCVFVVGCSEPGGEVTPAEDAVTVEDVSSDSGALTDTETASDSGADAALDAPDADDTILPPDPPLDAPTTATAPLPECTTSLRPLVFAHGFLASGDNFALQAQRLSANGHCPAAIHAFDWDTLANDTPAAVEALDAFIAEVLAQSGGVAQVDLIGHSAGGGLGLAYLADPTRAAKVAHYAHIASTTEDVLAPPVPTLSITSDADLVVTPAAEIQGAQNIRQADHDHLQALTSAETFGQFFEFFYGTPPATQDPAPTEQVFLAGKALTLGTNTPLAGGRVFAYPLDPATGQRLQQNPQAILATDAQGHWGPFQATANTPYELAVHGPDEARPIRYYVEPFAATSHLVYLRTFPSPGSLAGFLLRSLRFDDAHTVAIAFTANQAAIFGRDSLAFDTSTILTTPEIAEPARSLIALFLYDGNNNQTSDLTPTGGALGSLPVFLGGLDLFIPADAARTLSMTFNGSTLRAPAWPSDTAGPVIMVFR